MFSVPTDHFFRRPEFLKRSVDNILAKLRGTKKLDLFECARVDPKYPIEETIKLLAEFVAEGKFDYIGMSECRAETLRRASSVCILLLAQMEYILNKKDS